jgi:TPR repeat protein
MDFSLKNGFYKLILLVVTFAIIGCSEKPQSDAANYQEGIDAYSKGEYSTALKKLQPVAERGNPQAQFYLGLMYSKGDGVKQDHNTANDWWNKAAEQKHTGAQENLGLTYAKGSGVARDWVQADKWFSIAAALGKETAINNKKTVEVHMQPESIAEANDLAKEWLEKHKK